MKVLRRSELALEIIRGVVAGGADELLAVGRVLNQIDGRSWLTLVDYAGYLDFDHPRAKELRILPEEAQARLEQAGPAVAAVLSLHPNGYVRQHALQRLAALPETPAVIAALAIGMLDPVPQVRQEASDALLPRFDTAQHLNALRVLIEARRRRRGRSAAALNSLLDLVFEQMTVSAFLDLFDGLPERRWAISLAHSLGELPAERLHAIVWSDRDAWLRRSGAKWLSEDGMAQRAGLLAHPDQDVRLIALRATEDLELDDLAPLVSDPMPAIRALACTHAALRGLDLGEWYRQSLWNGDSRLRAICLEGLGRFGDSRDVPVLRDHLVHNTRQVRIAAERSMAKILLRP